MWAIIEERKRGPITDFDDLEKRVRGLTNTKSLIAKRIIMELQGADRYRVFVRPPSRRVSVEGEGPYRSSS
jgi:predicted nucleic acid-binding OB-fold protein